MTWIPLYSTLFSCEKLPETSFTYSPMDNPEHKFAEVGNFEVTLTATNDAGDLPKTETLTINPATILSFFILDSTETTPLSQAEVLVYDNQADWEAFENELASTTTNAQGEAVFMNMESIVYYILAFKEEAEGYWISGGSTSPITLNETTIFSVPCVWVPNDPAKAAIAHPDPVKLLKR